MPALAHVLDVPMIRRHDERDARRLRETHERRQKGVIRAQHRAGPHIVHRMPRDVRLEKLEEREVVLGRETVELRGRALGRDNGNVGIAILYRLPRQILHQRPVVLDIRKRRNRLRNRKRHDRRHTLETPRGDFRGALHEKTVGELDLLPALREFQKDIVRLDDRPQGRPGEPLAMPSHRLRTVHAREHRRLPCRGLRKPLDAQARVYRLAVPGDEPLKHRTNFRVYGVVRCRRAYSHAINE